MTDLIETIVTEGFKETPTADVVETPIIPETKEVEQPEQVEVQAETETVEQETKADGEQGEEWPSKAKTALRHAKRQVSKFKERNESLERELSNLRARLEAKPELKAPKEEDFTDYTDYVEAKAEHKVEQKLYNLQEEQTKSKISELEKLKEHEYITERATYAEERDNELRSSYSDFDKVTSGYEPIFDAMPKELQKTFIDIDDGSAALYVLAREGKLERLLQMPSDIAKLEIVQAQYRLPAPNPQAIVSKAPTPLQAVKGNASTQKTLNQKSGKELLSWVNS